MAELPKDRINKRPPSPTQERQEQIGNIEKPYLRVGTTLSQQTVQDE